MSEHNVTTTTTEKSQPSELPVSSALAWRGPLLLLVHLVAFTVALVLSFLVTNYMQFRHSWFVEQFPYVLMASLVIKLSIFGMFRQYRGWWRYVGISDLFGIFHASFVSAVILFTCWWLAGGITAIRSHLPIGITEISQGVFVMDWFATIMILAGLRMFVRIYHEEFRTVEGSRLKRFLIVGAGDAGESLLREIHRMAVAEYDVIGFIDDAPAKQGRHIHGIPVLGTVDQLSQICEDRNIDEIAVAMPSATHAQLRRVIQVCEGAKIRFRTVPALVDIATGKYRVSQIRDVDINDLLGREAVQLDLDSIRAFIQDKVILVTGAGGSIGSEMCRQICQFGPKRLLLVEQAENPLFYIERELRRDFMAVDLVPIICDITDVGRVAQIFVQHRPQVVIHAAAHKHVPLMELNTCEAIKNNVIGTRTVADAADQHGSSHFVMISTDKAVNPTSVMGASKRVAELYIQDLSRSSECDFVTVRFGNVLGSDGSVVPIFKKQIAEGGPVTVTHPDMKRYFMTIPEASQLVLQAATMGKGGEIFVLDMGEPVKIVDLAKELITLSGFRPGEDIEITFTGIRPGEKLFEELRIEGEDMQRTCHPKIGIWTNIPMDRTHLYRGIEQLIEFGRAGEREAILNQIQNLVPEFAGAEQ